MKISKSSKNKSLQDNFGIWTCDYPPQENKSGMPEYSEGPLVSEFVAQEGVCKVNSDNYHSTHWDLFSNNYRNNLLNTHSLHNNEDSALDLILQTIAENSQELLPLLNLLREKSENDKRILKLVEELESKLSFGIRVACTLAPREMEVLDLAAKGKSNSEIANELNIQVITVGKTLTRVYKKLNAKNRADAVFKWINLQGYSG